LGAIVHLTAPHALAGWADWLTLEIYNLGPFNIELKSGMAIGPLTFWRAEDLGNRVREGILIPLFVTINTSPGRQS